MITAFLLALSIGGSPLTSGQQTAASASRHKSSSETKLHVTKQRAKELSVFFSNFSEARVPDFSSDKPLSQDQLLEFAVLHRHLNQPKKNLMTLKEAQEIVDRYFGRKLVALHAFDAFKMAGSSIDTDPHADGEEFFHSVMESCFQLSGNKIRVKVVDLGDRETKMHHEGVVQMQKGHYVLLSYKSLD